MGDMSDIIRRVEAQDQRLEELEENISKALSELQRTTDEKFGKGLAMVLASADRKIDKGLATVQDGAKNSKSSGSQAEIEKRLKSLEDAVKKLKDQTGVAKEVILATAQMRENLDRIGTRMTKIEQYLVELTKKSSQRK
jgi:KaiC/GvpD/RAD55 family RecA-like ATPase